MSSRRVILPLPAQRKRSLLSRGKLWIGIVFVFGLQLGLILWFGERTPIRPRPAAAASDLRLVGKGWSEWLEMLDPTIFALPHAEGFSGAGWLIPPTEEIRPFAWSEPPRWLNLSVARLGLSVGQSYGTTTFDPVPPPARPEPSLSLAQSSATDDFPAVSSARLEGDLVNRRLLRTLDLPSWPYTDLVSNSVVQLLVDADGVPISVALLERSGLEAADKLALKEARNAAFEPLPRGEDPSVNNLAWGMIVFQWHTVPTPPAISLPVRP
jgi:TonB family protein